jgi:hypothetical protein
MATAYKVVGEDFQSIYTTGQYGATTLAYKVGEEITDSRGMYAYPTLEPAVGRWLSPNTFHSGGRIIRLEHDEDDVKPWPTNPTFPRKPGTRHARSSYCVAQSRATSHRPRYRLSSTTSRDEATWRRSGSSTRAGPRCRATSAQRVEPGGQRDSRRDPRRARAVRAGDVTESGCGIGMHTIRASDVRQPRNRLG